MTPITIRTIKDFFGKGIGRLVNLGCGDGRYDALLSEYGSVTAIDLDPMPLLKLKRDNPRFNGNNLLVQAKVQVLPMGEGTIQAVFSAGFIHLFDHTTLKEKIAPEIIRILEPGGKMFLDFSYDIQRLDIKTGLPYKGGEKPSIDREGVINSIINAFPDFQIEFEDGDLIEREFADANPPYKIICKNLIVTAIKNS